MLRRQYILKLEQAEEHSPIIMRIAMVIEALDAERLLVALDGARGSNGRNDHPNRVLWHCLVAFGCLGVRTVSEGLRYLELSGALQHLCGIESRRQLPSKHALYRFERRLAGHLDLLAEMFARLVRRLAEVLPDFGERLATDSTKIHSLANGRKQSADSDASWKKYEHTYTDENGIPKKSVVKWFGYKLHLVVDAVYELPIAELLSTAKDNDAPHFPEVWERAKENVPDLLKRARSNALDKGYDDKAVERVNGRLKDRWGLDCVTRRGLKRVQVWSYLALVCMNAFALTMAQARRLSEVRKTVYSMVS
jgi:hypothetical protein